MGLSGNNHMTLELGLAEPAVVSILRTYTNCIYKNCNLIPCHIPKVRLQHRQLCSRPQPNVEYFLYILCKAVI
jgi:hypothetical protein